MTPVKVVINRLRLVQLVLMLMAVFAIGFTVGTLSSEARAQSGLERGELLFRPLLEAYTIIVDQYVDPFGREVRQEALLDGAIKGMVDALDDEYSGYMNPASYALSNSDLAGQFEGIGVVIRRGENGIEVVGVMEGTPAAQAGVRVGDVFVEVDGVDVTRDNNLELATKVRGPAGTTVSITFRRGSELITLEIVRARIEIPNIEQRIIEGTNLAYIKLRQFTSDARQQINRALADLDVNNRDGLILDLRGNNGGLLSSAIEVGSAFIESGPIVIEDFGEGRPETVLSANGSYAGITVPIVVLVDKTTASASELVAGALQDLDVATLIGEPTLGKGTVQTLRQLSNGGGVRITIARWLTPGRKWIHGEGITPDLIVERSPDEVAEDTLDSQLRAAVEYLEGLQVLPAAAQQVK